MSGPESTSRTSAFQSVKVTDTDRAEVAVVVTVSPALDMPRWRNGRSPCTIVCRRTSPGRRPSVPSSSG